MNNSIRKLYLNKKNCCGCGACANVCPQNCISYKTDENGFLFPEVDMTCCVNCDLCKKVCSFQNEISSGSEAIKTYAAINRNNNLLQKSSSGGAFSALADIVFAKDGVVYGCAWNENLEANHVCISTAKDLDKLHGSKYVQSNIGISFKEAEVSLKNGKNVLFSGTPCQIAGLNNYLGKEYENLITAELVCHGVPNVAFFKSYIAWLENKLNGKITQYSFRYKGKVGKASKINYQSNGKSMDKIVYCPADPYYSLFMDGHIARESCYRCKYASPKRQADFTLGDYWGFQKTHPTIDTDKGVSVLLVNSKKGVRLVEQLEKHLYLIPSTFEQAALENWQLREHIQKSSLRENVFITWREGGFIAVANNFYKKNMKRIILFHLKRIIPKTVKVNIKKLLKLSSGV